MISSLSGGVAGEGVPRFGVCFSQRQEGDRWLCRVTFADGKAGEASFALSTIMALWHRVHWREFSLNQEEKEAYQKLLAMRR